MRINKISKFITVLFVVLSAVTMIGTAETEPPDNTSLSSKSSGITLDEAVAQALKFNPDLKAFRKTVDIARSEITRANTFTNPQALLDIRKGPNRDPAPNLEFELAKEIRLGSWWFNRKAAKAGYEATKQGLRSAEQALIREVKSTFYLILSLERKLDLANETIRLNNELAKVARARFKRGEVSEAETNILEVERDSSVQEKKRLKAVYLSEMLRFKNLLGFFPKGKIRLQGKFSDHDLSLDLDRLLLFAIEHRPDLLAARNRIKQAKAQAVLAKVEAFPPVTLGFLYTQETSGEDLFGAQFSIGVPIFDQNRADIQQTRAVREQTDAKFDAAQIQAQREIRTAYNNLRLLKDRIDIYEQEMKPKLEKTLEIYNGAYRSGQVSIFEILINQRQYFKTKGNYLDTLNEYEQKASELERVVGGTLEEIVTQEGMI